MPDFPNSGRLRLLRTGTTLQFLWSPDLEGDTFQEIRSVEFGDEDLHPARSVKARGPIHEPRAHGIVEPRFELEEHLPCKRGVLGLDGFVRAARVGRDPGERDGRRRSE